MLDLAEMPRRVLEDVGLEMDAVARLAFLLTQDRSTAEELAMEAFARALAGWRRIGSMDRPDLYLRRIVVNLDRLPSHPGSAAGDDVFELFADDVA